MSAGTRSDGRLLGRDGARGNRRVIAAATIACLRAPRCAQSCNSVLGSVLHDPAGLDIRVVALAPRTPWGSAGGCPRTLLLELVLLPPGRAARGYRRGEPTVLRRVIIVVVPCPGAEVVVVTPPGPLSWMIVVLPLPRAVVLALAN